jgi:hypothetical protein
MNGNNTPSRDHSTCNRRGILKTTAGLAALPVVAATSSQTILAPTDDQAQSSRTDYSSPEETAKAYISALDTADRKGANELIADDGNLAPWSDRAFDWVEAFEFAFEGFQSVKDEDREVIGDVDLTVDGNDGPPCRYRFRELDTGRWKLWESLDGLRFEAEGGLTARDAAELYINALNAADREAANELIADSGEINPWTPQGFNWVKAFKFEFVGFSLVRRDGQEAIGDVDFTVDGNDGPPRRYRFRELDTGRWKLWESLDGTALSS